MGLLADGGGVVFRGDSLAAFQMGGYDTPTMARPWWGVASVRGHGTGQKFGFRPFLSSGEGKVRYLLTQVPPSGTPQVFAMSCVVPPRWRIAGDTSRRW